MSQGIVVIGAGGHAVSVISALEAAHMEIAGYIDQTPSTLYPNLRHLGGDAAYLEQPKTGLPHFCALGDNALRKKLQALYIEKGIAFTQIFHPSASIEKTARLGLGIFVGAMAYVGGHCQIGEGTIVNNHANVDHECHIGSYSHLAPGSILTGGVQLGHSVFIGAGACVIPGVKIGDGALVGAGATVIGDVPNGATVYGTPAR